MVISYKIKKRKKDYILSKNLPLATETDVIKSINTNPTERKTTLTETPVFVTLATLAGSRTTDVYSSVGTSFTLERSLLDVGRRKRHSDE